MNRSEAKKIILKHSKLRIKIKYLRDKIWRCKVSSEDFNVYQKNLAQAEIGLNNNVPLHRQALRVILCSQQNAGQTKPTRA